MARRSFYPIGLLCFFFAVPSWGSPPLGAVVQTWNYDPLTNIATLKIVNASHTDITAFNIAIKETYADVTYIDGTADSTNSAALRRIVEEREATVASKKIATAIIHTALADPNDTDPFMAAARKIQDRATTWRRSQHIKLDLDPVVLESIAHELTTMSSGSVNKLDRLKQIVDREEAETSLLSVHAVVDANHSPTPD